jgi:hypothetical protein
VVFFEATVVSLGLVLVLVSELVAVDDPLAPIVLLVPVSVLGLPPAAVLPVVPLVPEAVLPSAGVPVLPMGVVWELCCPAPVAGSLAAGLGGVL